MPDISRELAMSIDRVLNAIHTGKLRPDAVDLLAAAHALDRCGEMVRADRCRQLAARLMPNLQKGARVD